MNDNPLMSYTRQAELAVKLPSNGKWYEEGMINYTANKEVMVYPMLPKDELLLLNPDALLNGEANINMIRSCVPAIKEPEKLYYPDANVLFLAIQKATYKNDITMEFICPNCAKKAAEIRQQVEDEFAKLAKKDKKFNEDAKKEADKRIAEAESRGEIMMHKQESTFNIDAILQSITFMKDEYVVETDNGLKIYMQPNTIKDKHEYGLIIFNQRKIVSAYEDYKASDAYENEEHKHIAQEVSEAYVNMNDAGNKILTSAVHHIVLPDGTYVDNKDNIYEFISKSESSLISKLNLKLKEINDVGLPNTLHFSCECCNYEWDDSFYGFNQTDFFGLGS